MRYCKAIGIKDDNTKAMTRWGNLLECDEKVALNSCLPWYINKWQLHLNSVSYVPSPVWILAVLCWGKFRRITDSYFCYHKSQLIFPGTPNGPVAQLGLFWLQPHHCFLYMPITLSWPVVFWDPGVWMNSTVTYNKTQKTVKERESKPSKDQGYST